MALTNINTGYTPEFALGAMYAGENAATNRMGNQLDLIKNFLANQREQQMQPLEVEKADLTNKGMVFDNMVKSLQGAQAKSQNTPMGLEIFRKAKEAEQNKNIRQNELDAALHPDRLRAAPMQGQQLVDYANIDSEISTAQRQLASGVGDNGLPLSQPLMDDLNTRIQELTARRGYTPEHWGKVDLENVKGEWDLEKQRLANQGHIGAANKGVASQAVQIANQYAGMIKNIDSKLTYLDTKESENEIMTMILNEGKKATPTEIANVKRQLKTKLEAEKAEYGNAMKHYQTMSGVPAYIPTQPTQPEKPQGTTIRYNAQGQRINE